MSRFLGIVRYEYKMSTRRPGLWLAFGLLYLFYGISLFTPGEPIPGDMHLWQFAGQIAFMFNLFMPVVGGISSADRLVRDRRLGVEELLSSTPMRRWTYIAGKYCGALLSILTPVFAFFVVVNLVGLIGGISLGYLPISLLSFLAMILPAYVFVIAFSLVCPVVIPLRVYQVLFTGYWFWGNYLNPKAFPSLSGTHLVPSGHVALLAWFGGGMFASSGGPEYNFHTLDAIFSLVLLAGCAALILTALERLMAWRAARA